MRRQVLRRLRPAAPFEIGGGADHGHAQVRPDPHRDHVLGHLLADAHAGVVALGHDVGEAIVDNQLHLDVGIVAADSFASAGHRIASAACSPAVMRMVPAGLSRSALSADELGIDLVKARADAAQQPFAGVRRRHAAGGAGQQPQAQPLLQRATVWLSADCDTPSWAAALVKLRSRATARKAMTSLKFSRGIHELHS